MKKGALSCIIVFLLLVGGFCFQQSYSKQGNFARIMVDGVVIEEIVLASGQEERRIDLVNPEGKENVIRIHDGKIGMESSNCPDKICVQRGMISGGILPVVCLPHRIVIEFEVKNESEIDSMTG